MSIQYRAAEALGPMCPKGHPLPPATPPSHCPACLRDARARRAARIRRTLSQRASWETR